MSKKKMAFLVRRSTTVFVSLTTILWSLGLPIAPLALAASPHVMMVQYVNPTTFQVKFDQAMDNSTISTGSFTLTTVAAGTNTITGATPSLDSDGKTLVTIAASGAKISAVPGDFVNVATASPNVPKNSGAEANVDGGNIGIIEMPGQVVISQVKLSGATATDEFLEIYNKTASPVDLTGWKVTSLAQDGTPTDLVAFTGADAAHMQSKLSLASGGFRLIGPTGTTGADATYTAAGNGLDVNNTIILYRSIGGGNFRVEDMLGCGTATIKEMTAIACPAANQSLQRKASPTSTAATLNASTTPAGSESTWGNSYDSNNNSFDFVLQTGSGVNPRSSASPAQTPGGGGGGYQDQPPTIMHTPVFQVISGADFTIMAQMADAETPVQGLTPNLMYSTDNGSSWTTLVGQYTSGQGFKFIIPSAATGSGTGTAFKYYLKATDGQATSSCMWNMGFGSCGASDASAKAGAWTVASTGSAGMTNSLKGTVAALGVGLNNATVTLSGAGLVFTATTATISGTAGAFAFSNIPAGMFHAEATAPGYLMSWLDGVVSKSAGAAFTDNTLTLTAGSGGGIGGDTTAPRVIFSAPMEGMRGAPVKINIPATGPFEAPMMIGFSKDMDSTTITTDNIKIYPVTAAGLGTAIAGLSVAYQPQNSTVTLSDRGGRVVGATDFGPDRKALIYSATALTANSQYVLDLSAGVKDSAGNVLQGNKSGGGHSISFTTAGDFTGTTTGQMTSNFNTFMTSGGGGGQFTPPYVTGSTPPNGGQNVPTNAKIAVNFSQPMDSTGLNATNSTGTYLQLYDTGSNQGVTVASITLDTTTRQIATITVGGSGLTAGHSGYQIRVLGGAKSATGVPLAMPGQENTVMYQANFSTGTGTDTGAPTVLSSTLQAYTGASPCSANLCVTGVPTNVGLMELSFSKDLDVSTINSSNVTLKSGTTSVSVAVSYNPLSRSIRIAPDIALYNSTPYTLSIGAGVKAMNGTALASAYVISFTTSSTVNTTPPNVTMASGDDYKIAVTFSEPMNAARATDATKWATSVLNPTNYLLYVNNSPPPFTEGTNAAKYFGNTTLATATDVAHGGPLTFKYDPAYNTVTIEGLKLLDSTLTIKGGFSFWVKNVTDISGNTIQDTAKPANVNDFGANAAGGPVKNSKDTFGNIGPGGGTMSGPPSTSALSGGGVAVTAFGGKDPALMGFKPVNVFPMNMLAGQESLYMIDLPLSQAIPASGTIILTFPLGFDVTNAADGDPNKRFAHKDINGPGTGTVTIASVTASATSRTVTITLGSTATQANDFLHLEIDRIKNTTQASDGDTAHGVTMGAGYQVDVYTMSGTRSLETLKSMPFFIKSAGTSTLTGTITFKDSSGANAAVTLTGLPIYLMSPATGPLKTLVNFSNSATATYTFSNLPTGSYLLGTEPLQTISGTDYYVDINPLPQSLQVASGSNTRNINFQAQSAASKPNLTVYITGTFSNESVDLFAGGPGNFSVKTVTLNGTFSTASPSSQTLYLPSTGTWMVGVGPAMPHGPQQAGPPVMPSWMPPKPVQVSVSGSGPSWTWVDPAGAATGDAANDGKITLGVTSASKTITGHVYGPTGSTGIQNAQVHAFSPLGGLNSWAESGADGSFTLKVTEGSYQAGAFIGGLPPSPEVPVEVKTVSGTTTVYANGAATTDVVIRMQDPSSMSTVSGKVTDGTNVIKDASVYARRTDAPGNVGSKTDSMGKYILYVSAGTWAVGVFLPQYGNLAEQTVTITTASRADVDFAPATSTTFRTVKDRVYKDVDNSGTYTGGDVLLANVHVDFDKTNYHNSALTDTNGQYSILVPDGTYTVAGWSPDAGKIPARTVTISGDSNLTDAASLPVADTKTVTVNFKDGSGNPVTLSEVYVQMDKTGSKNISNETDRQNVSSLTLQVPAGSGYNYTLGVGVPGVKSSALTMAGSGGATVTGTDVNSDGNNDIYQVTVDNNKTVNVTVPTLYTVSGTAKDDSGNLLPKTTINIKKVGSPDVATTAQTDASGNYSISLPASGTNTPYLLQIDRSGYVDTGTSLTVTGNVTDNLVANKSNLNISGQIKIGSAGVQGAKVFAKQLGAGFASTETDAQGNYTLPVTAGDWKVSAASDGYQEKKYQDNSGNDQVVSLSSTSQSGVNVTLATQKAGLATMNNSDVNPSAGATFEHAAAGLNLVAPQNAIASSQSTYQLEDYEVSNVTSSPTAKTIGGKAVEINTYQPSGSSMMPKSGFDSKVTIEKKYSKSDLAAEGIDTFTKAQNVAMSYFDDTASNWEPVLTNTTYLDSSDRPVIPTNNLSNVASVVYAGSSDHTTVYSPTNGSPDGLAPSSPTTVAGAASSGQVSLSWAAPTTNADTTPLTDLLGYEVYRSTSAGGTYTQINASDVTSTSYTDNTVSAGSTYYYKVTAADTGGIESTMSTVSSGILAYVGGGGGGAISFGAGAPVVSVTASPSPSASPSATPSPSVSPTPSASPTPATPSLVSVPAITSSSTQTEIQAAIVAIQNNISVLLAELAKLQASEGKVSAFVHDLQYAMAGDPEIKRLQGFLVAKGYLAAGLDTGNYLSKTVAAVKLYQKAKGISPANGRFGPLTRKTVNQDLGL